MAESLGTGPDPDTDPLSRFDAAQGAFTMRHTAVVLIARRTDSA